ncbi:hypothetical protein [Burkholderia multivorans]|uniref:hypothetical protein n=1 Tax=Burkholderia multivorans TaxID=87883 RepID=UPI0011B205F9|nr:hypothetical protein [Burkholderia multivorans]
MNIIHFFTVTDSNLNLAEIDEWIFAQGLEAFRVTNRRGISDPGHSHSISSSGPGYLSELLKNYVTPTFVFKDSEAATLFKLQYGDGCDHKVEERKDCARNYGNDFTNWIYKI